MARLTEGQKGFVRGCVANYLDTKDGTPHKTAEMARWVGIAYRKEHGEALKVSTDAIRAAITSLRDEGYYIARDPKGKGFRCLRGKRNGHPDMLGIITSLGHEKQVIAATIENQVVKPMEQVRDTIIVLCPADKARLMVAALREQTPTIADAVAKVRALDEERYVLVPESKARRLLGTTAATSEAGQ